MSPPWVPTRGTPAAGVGLPSPEVGVAATHGPAPHPSRNPTLRTPIVAGLSSITLLIALGASAYWSWQHPAIHFTNELAVPVELTVGGRPAGVVAPGASWETRVPRQDSLTVQWRPIPPSDRGQVVGQAIVATLAARAPDRPLATVPMRATAVWPSGAAFQPLITNATNVPLRVVVNPGLSLDDHSLEAECRCQVAPGTRAFSVGFYDLVGNSAVRAVMPDGRSATFRDLGRNLDRHSGVVRLRFTPEAFRMGG